MNMKLERCNWTFIFSVDNYVVSCDLVRLQSLSLGSSSQWWDGVAVRLECIAGLLPRRAFSTLILLNLDLPHYRYKLIIKKNLRDQQNKNK